MEIFSTLLFQVIVNLLAKFILKDGARWSQFKKRSYSIFALISVVVLVVQIVRVSFLITEWHYRIIGILFAFVFWGLLLGMMMAAQWIFIRIDNKTPYS